MPLTPEQREQLEQTFNTGGGTTPGVSSRMERLQNVVSSSIKPPPPPPPPEPEKEAGFFSSIGQSVKKRLADVSGSLDREKRGEQSKARTLFQAGTQPIGFAGDLLFEGAKALGNLFIKTAAKVSSQEEEVIKRDISLPFRAIAETDIGQRGLEALGGGIEKYNKFKEENPALAADLESTLRLGDLLLATKVTKIGGRAVKEAAEEVIDLSKKQSKIADTIAPQINAKETQKIVSEGRATRGKKKLFGKRPDVVEQAEQVKRSAQTIDNRIKGASEMDDLTLSSNIKNEVSNISNELKPEMQAITVTSQKLKEMDKVWDALKKTQADEPEFVAFAGSKKVQERFGRFLSEMKQLREPVSGQFKPQKTLDDLWDIRKRYDSSIPESVKQAIDGVSSPSSSFQKTMWLENRQIMNDMIKDTADGLGDTAKTAFSDMTDLYRARQQIIIKTKLDLKGTPGLAEIIKKNALKYGIAWLSIKGVEQVTGVNIPLL